MQARNACNGRVGQTLAGQFLHSGLPRWRQPPAPEHCVVAIHSHSCSDLLGFLRESRNLLGQPGTDSTPVAAREPCDRAVRQTLAGQIMDLTQFGMATGPAQMPLLRRGIVGMGRRRLRSERPTPPLPWPERWRRQRSSRQAHYGGDGLRDAARLMKETELMGRSGPNLREDRRIRRRPIRDHFLRTDPGLPEPAEKRAKRIFLWDGGSPASHRKRIFVRR